MKKSPVHSISFFLQNGNMFVTIFIITVVIVSLPGCDYFFPPLKGDKITVEEAYKYMDKHKDDPDVVLLDIRTKHEYDSLKIERSINLDYSMPDFPDMTDKLDKNKRYIVIDKNGKRSPLAFELMKEQKITNVHYIIGGLEEWIKMNYPVNK